MIYQLPGSSPKPHSKKQQVAPKKCKHQGPGCPSWASCAEFLVLSIGNQPLVFNSHGRCCKISGVGSLRKWLPRAKLENYLCMISWKQRFSMFHQRCQSIFLGVLFFPKLGVAQDDHNLIVSSTPTKPAHFKQQPQDPRKWGSKKWSTPWTKCAIYRQPYKAYVAACVNVCAIYIYI